MYVYTHRCRHTTHTVATGLVAKLKLHLQMMTLLFGLQEVVHEHENASEDRTKEETGEE